MGKRPGADCSVLFVLSVGLIGGVAVSTFSKTLALVFGMLVFGVQVSDIGVFDMGDGRWGKADWIHVVFGFERI